MPSITQLAQQSRPLHSQMLLFRSFFFSLICFRFFPFPNGNFEVDLVLPVLLEQFKSKRLEGEGKARGKFRFNSMMRVLQNNAHVVFILAGF
jgi:hypothetical protein